MIPSAENVDPKWSEKKMEESDALRTVECLRGRLIAERTASKNSKDEADQLANKLIELEKKVKEEIKSRNRVEKKLRFLMKKLENLNISYSSDQEGSSNNSIFSHVSSSSSDPNHKILEDTSDEHKTQMAESQSMIQTSEISSLSTRSSFASIKDHNLETEDFSSPTSSMGSSMVKESEGDDSMALVLVDLKVDEECSSVNYVSGNVKDVLDALKHAREKIQSSMEKKRIMIKVGSQLGKQ